MRSEWEREKRQLEKTKQLKTQLEKRKNEYHDVLAKGDYSKAAELQYGILPDLEKQIAQMMDASKNNQLISEVVTEDDIAAIVAKWTQIPVQRLLQGDKEKLLSLCK
ncbi:MAG: hypothetical protein MZU97_04600 [Bacillus subtilis]|nr:hypothetical protein [Bacillus subtilis]